MSGIKNDDMLEQLLKSESREKEKEAQMNLDFLCFLPFKIVLNLNYSNVQHPPELSSIWKLLCLG